MAGDVQSGLGHFAAVAVGDFFHTLSDFHSDPHILRVTLNKDTFYDPKRLL